ncbi:hypothetical protein J6590_013515 [Homalodisca vitripennis]|nr:hypothetical protein J6590_013515 [Homalodisca vitripennis]
MGHGRRNRLSIHIAHHLSWLLKYNVYHHCAMHFDLLGKPCDGKGVCTPPSEAVWTFRLIRHRYTADFSCQCIIAVWRSRRFRPSTTNTPSGAHGGIVQSRTEVDLILTDFDKDKREAIVSLPRKMLVKYTAGNDCQHQKSSTILINKKYTEENSV